MWVKAEQVVSCSPATEGEFGGGGQLRVQGVSMEDAFWGRVGYESVKRVGLSTLLLSVQTRFVNSEHPTFCHWCCVCKSLPLRGNELPEKEDILLHSFQSDSLTI